MKSFINSFILLFGFFSFSTCITKDNDSTSNSNVNHSLILISDSAFIAKIKTFNLVVNQEKRVGPLQYIVKETPATNKSYYIIQVGKINRYRFEIFGNYYCYPKIGNIKFYDTFNDTLIEPN